MPSCLRAFLVCLLLSASAGHVFAEGSAAAPDRPPSSSAAARFIPDDVTFLVEAERLGEVEAALKRVNAWRLLSLAAGRAGASSPFSFRLAVADMLGARNDKTIERLMTRRMTVAGHSWRQPESWVWLVQPVDDALLEEWFAADARLATRRAGNTLMFTTADGRAVAVRDGVAAVTHAEPGRGLFDQVKARMTGDVVGGGGAGARRSSGADARRSGNGGANADGGADFRRLAEQLPADRLVTILWHSGEPASPLAGAAPSSTGSAARAWGGSPLRGETPTHADGEPRAAAVGVVEEGDRLRLEYRSISPPAPRESRLGSAAVDLIQRLPDETLLVWAAEIDLKTQLKAFMDRHAQAPPILARLEVWPPSDEVLDRLLASLGHHMVVVWGPSAGSTPFWPQIAVMVELGDAPRAAEGLESFLSQQWAESDIADVGGGGAVKRTVMRETHLGRTIHWWRDDAPLMVAATATSLTVPGLEPAFAVMDGWLIAALSRDHVRRIIEARSRLSPTLNRLPLLGKTARELAAGRSVAVVQPAMASTMLMRWMQDAAEGRPSIFSAEWWPTPPQPVRTRRIGITVRVNNDPGVVEVVHVYPDSPVAGLIKPGDRIVGVDGTLLSLAQSNVDLRARLAESAAAAGPAVRLLRDGVMLDVTLPIDSDVDWAPPLDPPVLLRELAAIGRRFDFAGFCTSRPDTEISAATLVLTYRDATPR